MTSIFRRILAWMAFLLVFSAAGWITTSFLSSPFDPKQRSLIGGIVQLQLDVAVEAWEQNGHAGLRRLHERLGKDGPVTWMLLDSTGRNLLTGRVEAEVMRAPEMPMRPPMLLPPPSHFTARFPSRDGRYILALQGGESVDIWARLNAYWWIVAVVLLLCYVMALTFVRPLRQLHAAVERFGAGDLTSRADIRRKDEIGDLGRAFNRMAERIQTLLEAERRLLLDVSHELRSPLTRLRIAAQLVHKDIDREEAAAQITREADRLTALVGDLLQVTRAEGDPDTRNAEPVDLAALGRELAQESKLQASEKQITIEIHAAGNTTVTGDCELLRRALGNALQNAIHHSSEGSTVELAACGGDKGNVVVTVRDHGPGVPAELLSDIFKPFFRVDSDRHRKNGTGVGLGLSIAERAIRLHGGTVEARNQSTGLEVIFCIPGDSPVARRV